MLSTQVQPGQEETPPAAARFLMIGGAGVRIAYGVGALLAPGPMAAGALAPSVSDEAEGRLLLRAFGGHQLVVGALTLAASKRARTAAPAALFSLLIDASDLASALLELGKADANRRPLTEGIAFSGLGAATFAAALWSLGRPGKVKTDA
jgi:hypothetical protein